MYLARSEPAVPTPVIDASTSASGPSAHTIQVRAIVVGVIAAVLGLCVVLWVFYILHGWWAIRAEVLRPRGNVEREPGQLEEAASEDGDSDWSSADHTVNG
ncbi:hypothetical protein C8Q80DRAFT_1271614 [Daedaleopsis nitida]|nr:hypothetical protein C8Q80DRAFT_1271614 [Daedaleopsis nitida]